ncbi:MAG: hypothetical protein HY646_04655 [Acidobacteria bacterium]|nr:hypothetical protein [Acidobacteriota bacterium]
MVRPTQTDSTVYAAAFGAAALIAHQVAGKATRDALFLSHFHISGLPSMVITASLLSIVTGVVAARVMSRVAPGRLIPRAFFASAVLLLLEWGLSYWTHSLVAVLIYLQMAALGTALISGFWSMLGDRYDPHTAKKQFTRIVGAGTFGGLIGGLLAERVGATFGVTSMLPVLAGLHLICGFLTSSVATGDDRRRFHRPAKSSIERRYNGFRVLKDVSYIRNLAILILLTTIGAELLDFVFKARAVEIYGLGRKHSPDLVRFFALFYTAAGVFTFVVQITASRFSLEKFGLAGTISSLPFTVALGSIGGFFLPGLGSMAVARSGEAVLRSSLFRSAYELLYAAVPWKDRRATKPILDIGFERMGDVLGGALISVVLLAGTNVAMPVMLALAAALGIIGVGISRQLHRGYIKALESSLLNQSIHIDVSDIRDSTTRSVMQTLGTLSIPPKSKPAAPSPITPAVSKPNAPDPLIQRILDLRSSHPGVVRRALELGRIDAVLAPHVIALLAWDAVADDAVKALQKSDSSIIGQLVDALLDTSQEFAVRRRIPRVLAVCNSRRAFEGAAQGLFDKRFEVRFQAGRALAQIQDRAPHIEFDRDLIVEAVLQELSVDAEVWDSRRVIDPTGDQDASSVSLEHVFRLLSLILPRDPLKIAYRSLHSGDDHLKGTALEYLETVLPLRVREDLWPLLERTAPSGPLPLATMRSDN